MLRTVLTTRLGRLVTAALTSGTLVIMSAAQVFAHIRQP